MGFEPGGPDAAIVIQFFFGRFADPAQAAAQRDDLAEAHFDRLQGMQRLQGLEGTRFHALSIDRGPRIS